ncbi:unnamed protein product [Amoebophrya sp. A120]|nr:unnamed protein product [Amoebophrya sp. A120]|eukprot:GSA120T00017785001.1
MHIELCNCDRRVAATHPPGPREVRSHAGDPGAATGEAPGVCDRTAGNHTTDSLNLEYSSSVAATQATFSVVCCCDVARIFILQRREHRTRFESLQYYSVQKSLYDVASLKIFRQGGRRSRHDRLRVLQRHFFITFVTSFGPSSSCRRGA